MSFSANLLSTAFDLNTSDAFEFNGSESIVSASVDGTMFVFVAGNYDDGIQVFSLSEDGTLTPVFNIEDADDPAYALSSVSQLSAHEIGGNSFLFAASPNEDTVSVFSIGASGALTLVDSVSDSDDPSYFIDFNPDNVIYSGISTGRVGSSTFMFVPGYDDNGISVFSIDSTGTLTNVHNEAATLNNLNLASRTLPVDVNGTTYLVTANDGNENLTVFSVSSGGVLSEVDRFDDDANTRMNGMTGLAHAAVGGTDYIFLSSYIEAGVSVFELSGTGQLSNVFNLADTAELQIGQTTNIRAHKIGGDTYLFVTSGLDDALNVFAVSDDGSLTLVSVINDPPADFNASKDIDLQVIGDRIFATEGAGVGAGRVNLLSLHNDTALGVYETFTRHDDGSSLMNGAIDVATATVGANTFVISGSYVDSALSVLSVDGTGVTANPDNVADDGSLNLANLQDVETFVDGGVTYVAAAGLDDDGFSIFSLDSSGNLTNTENVSDNGTYLLNGIRALTSVELDGTTFLLTASGIDDGVSVFALSSGLVSANTDNVSDNGVLEINGAWGIETAEVGGVTYVFVAGRDDAGISVFQISNSGVLTNVSNFDGAASGYAITQPESLAAVEVEGTTYLYAGVHFNEAGGIPGGIVVFEVSAGGNLTPVQRIIDDDNLNLGNTQDLEIVKIGGVNFLAVVSETESGVSLFAIDDGGRLSNAANFADGGLNELLGASGLASAIVDGSTQLYVASRFDDTVSGFTLSNSAQLGFLNADNESSTDNVDYTLAIPQDGELVTVGGNSFFLVAGNGSSGVTSLAVDGSGNMSFADSIVDDGSTNLSSPSRMAAFEVGGTQFAAVTTASEGFAILSVAGDGSLAVTDNVSFGSGNMRSVTAVDIGGTQYLFVADTTNDTVAMYSVDAAGTASFISSVADNGTLNLEFPAALATYSVGGETYLIGASGFSDGVSVFRIEPTGSPSFLEPVFDLTDATNLAAPTSIETATINGNVFVYIASSVGSWMTIYLANDDGSLTEVDAFNNASTELQLSNPQDLRTVEFGGVHYLLVAAFNDDTAHIFRIRDDGSLSHVDSVSDNGTRNLDGVNSLSAGYVEGLPMVFSVANNENGVSSFLLNTPPVEWSRGGETQAAFEGVQKALDHALDGDTIRLNPDYHLDETALGVVDDSLTVDTGANGGFQFTLDTGVTTFSLFGTGSANATALDNSGVTINGSTGSNALVGGSGFDTLIGNGGDDTIDGLSGDDIMVGGAGNDTFVVDSANDIVSDGPGEGTDQVNSHVGFTLFANLEHLSLLGSASVNAIGNELDNNIFGNAGNNTLDGLTGADNMIGGDGDDIYVVDNVGDSVSDSPGASGGTDQVNSYVSFSLFAYLENLSLLGSDDINAIGNSEDNVLIGNAGNNTIDGLGGADTMIGNAGNDIFVVDNVGDTVADLASGGGIDQVNSSVSFALVDHIENLSLLGSADINAVGNTLDNILIGNTGNNTIDGLAGADTMVGGDGDDIYVVDNVGDVVSDNPGAGGGIDQVNSFVSFTLFANLENLSLLGSGNIDATGNELDNNLFGNSGNNRFLGNAGNDLLIGNGGNDTYVFGDGAGNDTITDFSAGAGAGDVIDIAAFGFADFAAVLAAADDSGGTGPTVIQLDGDDSITLQGVLEVDLAADDFILN